jgi:hypothetical protein
MGWVRGGAALEKLYMENATEKENPNFLEEIEMFTQLVFIFVVYFVGIVIIF